MLREVPAQGLAHLRAALRVADRVDQDLVARQADLGQQSVREIDDLDVDRRLLRAVALDVPLPELSEPQLLRALAAEHRLVSEVALRARRLVEARVEECPRDRWRRFRSERELALAVKLDLEHLLAHDIGRLAGC